MALTYPLTYPQFLGALRVEEVSFRLSQPQEHTRLGDGTVISASLGAALWTGSIRLAQAPHPQHAQIEALLALLDQPGATFLCHDPRQIGPAGDPGGVILGSATPAIHSIGASMRELRIAELPAGYVLSPGDMLGFPYGSGPVRQALHRIVVGSTASSGGLTLLLEVVPALRPGAGAGLPVTLIRPACKARLLPDPGFGTGRQALSRGASFDFIQTLR